HSARRLLFALVLAIAAAAGSIGLAAAQDIPMEKLMAPGALPDIVQGKADAPVAIVEYGSLTCPHCAAFHAETWPALKSKYVDAGKVRFIFREFPRDPLDAAAFMLARCVGPERRDAIVDLLFTSQKDWAFVDKPLRALAGVVKQAGISQNDFETCLQNQDLYSKVLRARDDAVKDLHIDSTPTFFINGKRLSGEAPIGDFDKALEPLLK
ncbi:MAG TPA: DsbA family protein, partial [Roseiarcus sp.]|nr:DsbA family protein [Roseiarcus sp.]